MGVEELMETFMLMTCRKEQLGFHETVFLNFFHNHFFYSNMWLRSSLVVRALTANAEVATVLGSILASSDTVKSEVAADKAAFTVIQYIEKKNPKKSPCALRTNGVDECNVVTVLPG